MTRKWNLKISKLLKTKNFETIIQMNNKTKIDSEMLPGDSWVKMILEIYAIWINPNNDFGGLYARIIRI